MRCDIPRLFEQPHAVVERVPGRSADQILQQKRHTAKRTRRSGAALRLRAGFVEERRDHRVQLRVDFLNPGNGRVHKFERGHLAPAYKFGLSGGVKVSKLVRHSSLLPVSSTDPCQNPWIYAATSATACASRVEGYRRGILVEGFSIQCTMAAKSRRVRTPVNAGPEPPSPWFP